ncbi:crotonase/enoyl-CoA hydratase family protein [Exilibacterium tricleocarpae]|uniref:Crotonase/enoyl-CoA hydratase family protein n=1 Tax=Exilibacterium tricleocarpae TaxID=2591008 RepID=A0A545TLU9_9GAMM|nr:crotonase/enoyl-CoA hydratase family protein [Exilibacterium tricleocarpae]TQV78217.1 crotonase/enoyl-CoA hydratase family protein [Exilibacterium tricleocarpae]
MTYQTLSVSIDNQIAHVQLSRPDEYNTMNTAFWQELPAAIREIDAAALARVIVLSSTGKHFTAGMDLSVFTSPDEDMFTGEAGRRQEIMRHRVKVLQETFNRLEQVRMPVLAAIQGGCIGGGVDMVTACDSRYCTADAFFCVKETDIGMTADLGTLQRLPRVIPQGLARELCYTARRCPAPEALAAGLVNRVFDTHEAMLEGVFDIAKQIARQSPLAVAGTKEMLNYSRDHTLADSLNYMAVWQTGMFQPTDMAEVFTAKAEGRDTEFEELRPLPGGF